MKNGDIKVVGEDRMCFYVDPVNLTARGCACYDAWAHTHPEPSQMSVGKWNLARAARVVINTTEHYRLAFGQDAAHGEGERCNPSGG